ncbi:DUF3995 domain-containing protein [Sinirhodobacter sp. HNIBRBA609]|nr:DUF3995 domain-containing protein [Sinirhodobacter sp. HNIBRBA609]
MPFDLAALFICTGLTPVVLFHLYWASGGRKGADLVIPTRPKDGTKLFEPKPLATLSVAAFLVAMGLLAASKWFGQPLVVSAQVLSWFQMGAGVIFSARALGDFHHIGFSKRVRGTPFAWWDDRLFSPFVLMIGIAFFILAWE